MAFDFSKFKKNGGNRVMREGIDTDGNEFVKLSEYVGKKVPVDGFFFTNGEYGKQVVVVSKGKNINMPKRSVEEFEGIASDPEARAEVLAGNLYLTNIAELEATKGRKATIAYDFGTK